ncbi:unnamed protein product [Peronospora belbahrii]|uniref:Homeobox domain-containing protein n=1 Tax=Peronospora belbahrii TaxID=622444 RepID=A0AAU9L0Q9_9STRA|nr:unnamed protein product [Peronospora belbahrii]CAH0514836.1 unnamed protein product [Peronospora belbahrii]
MTFPNRDIKCIVKSTKERAHSSTVLTVQEAAAMSTEWKKNDSETIGMQHEFQLMLTGLSPTHMETTLPSVATKKDNLDIGNSLIAVDETISKVYKTHQTSMSLARISPYAKELGACSYLSKRRSSLSKLAKKLMQDWFNHNLHNPYPTEQEKLWLAEKGGITLEQVSNWFINTRGRKWKPMLTRLLAEKQATRE